MFDQSNDDDGNGNGNGNGNENGVKIVLFEPMRQRHQLSHKHHVKQVQNKMKKLQQQLTFKFEAQPQPQPQQRYLNFNFRRIYQNPWNFDRRELNVNNFKVRRVNNNMIVNEMIDTNSLIIVLIVNANSVERIDGFDEFHFVKQLKYDSKSITPTRSKNPVTDFSKSTMKMYTENNAKQIESNTDQRENVLVSQTRASLKSTKQQHKHRSPKKPQNIKLKMSEFLKILFQYAMLFNCLTQLVSGNLMTRNVGNDIGNDHNNQSAIDQNQTAFMANRLSMTTAMPNILAPIETNNRTQFGNVMGSVQQQSGGGGDGDGDGGDQRQQQQQQQHFKFQQYQDTMGFAADESSNPNEESGEEYSRCPACQFREQLKAHNLASIKMHILHRLSMEKPPNITGRPHISENILQHFYQTKDFRYIRIRNNSFDDSSSDEMQGDDPAASHQHHYIHGGKSGLQPHHHHQTSYHGHHHLSRSGRNNSSSSAGGIGNGAGGNSKKNSGGNSNNKFGSDSEYNEDDDYNLNERGGIAYNMDYYDEPRTSSRSHYADMDQSDADSDEEPFYSMTDVIYSFPRRK